MIIKEIKSSRNFLFFSRKIQIVTDKDKIIINREWDQEVIESLNESLKNFKLESAEDFLKLREKLKHLNEEKYKDVETGIISGIKMFWKFFNPGAVQVPRPIVTVLSKEKGIREFVVFSLNSNNFDDVVNAGLKIRDYAALNEKLLGIDVTNPSELGSTIGKVAYFIGNGIKSGVDIIND